MAEVTLPQLGETVTEGTITRWFKKVGDTVAADEPLFEVSTDKVDTEVPSPVAGVLIEIRVPEGETVPVGAVIGVVGDAGAVVAAPPAASPAPVVEVALAPVVAGPAPAPAPVVAAPVSAAAPAAGNDNRLLSPVVRRLVTEHNLNVDSIAGTGPGGRITREDVLDHIDKIAAGSAPTAPSASRPAAVSPAPVAPTRVAAAPVVRAGERDDIVPLSKIRQLTGAHMTMSLSVSPHALSVVEVDYANIDNTRAKTKDEFKSAEGFSLTYLPFISRAVVDALVDFPHMNASISGTDLIVHRYVDLGIAVDIEGLGLLVPVVRSAEGKRLRAIAREISDLATRAKTRKLSPDEIQGGTFTISNNGSAGSVLTMAIINQPQVAILSTDAIVRKPVVVNVPGGGESIAIHPVGHLAMSWDHRAFDGAYAASFLVRVKEILETRDWSSEF
ncbi:MAG: dihydrolipoamide acetyltransferase family protein [Actinomycetota bacterium]|nr:dihydrolipoamide acetyltransferase family protein [Actinomycetota bacterium]MDA3018740.1 dihydrolipoamide acetyltransferase family protein [Actinomycetota bacterium]